MKRRFYQIAKKLKVKILEYTSYREKEMGGLQVYSIKVKIKNRVLLFSDSYFHLSGDQPKVLRQFEQEIKAKQEP